MNKGVILLCAGGTGGHLFPAEAVAHEMIARGYTIHLAADERVERFAGKFPAEEIHQISSATFASKNPVSVMRTLFSLYSGYAQSGKLIDRLKPKAVAGFGGYPTLPPLMAAQKKDVPTLVHEANAVLGRANRFLGKRVDKVAIGFGNTSQTGKISVTVTGNPVRPEILDAAHTDYPERVEDDPFNLLVFGGSQGAAYFSDALPKAIAALPQALRERLKIVQQARPEDREQLILDYENLNVEATVETFFSDMHHHIANAHLVISRAGASTVSELAVIGRPALLVPYPFALDHDQAANAANMLGAGGATIFEQADLDADVLAEQLASAIGEPKRLALAAKKAKKTGKPDATRALADMLEHLIAQ